MYHPKSVRSRTTFDVSGVTDHALRSWPSGGAGVTSRKPPDIPAFNSTMIEAFSGMMLATSTESWLERR